MTKTYEAELRKLARKHAAKIPNIRQFPLQLEETIADFMAGAKVGWTMRGMADDKAITNTKTIDNGISRMDFVRAIHALDTCKETEGDEEKEITSICDECGLRLHAGEKEPPSHLATSHMMRDV